MNWVNRVNWSSMNCLVWGFNLDISHLWLNIDNVATLINSNDLLWLCMDWNLNNSSLWLGVNWMVNISWLFNNHWFWNLNVMWFNSGMSVFWDLYNTWVWSCWNFNISRMRVLIDWNGHIVGRVMMHWSCMMGI